MKKFIVSLVFLAGCGSFSLSDVFDTTLPAPETRICIGDLNRDGKTDQAEVGKLTEYKFMNVKTAVTDLSSIDQDGDKEISDQEFAGAVLNMTYLEDWIPGTPICEHFLPENEI